MRDWASLNAVLLTPFLMEAVVLDSETSETELLKIFAANISECGLDAAAETSEIKDEEEDESGEDEENTKKEYGKVTSSKETDAITANCEKVLAFLQAIVMKATRVEATPLLLHADKCAQE